MSDLHIFTQLDIEQLRNQSLFDKTTSNKKPSPLNSIAKAPFSQKIPNFKQKTIAKPKPNLAIFNKIQNILEKNDEFLIISNIRQKKNKNYYSLLIDRKKLHLFEKHANKERNIYYYYKNQTAMINNQKMSDDFLIELGNKIERISKDLEFKKADLYEKDI